MIREVVVGKVAAHLCLTPIVKELKISVEHGKVALGLDDIWPGPRAAPGNYQKLLPARPPEFKKIIVLGFLNATYPQIPYECTSPWRS